MKKVLSIFALLTVMVSTSWAANSLRGTFNSWSSSANVFSNGTTIVNLSASTTYEFKVVENNGSDAWYGNNGTITATVSDWTFATDKGNCKITTGAAGDYVFTYNASTHKLSVNYPTSASAKDYYLKHPWNGSSSWDWKKLTPNADNTLYTIEDYYGGNGCNWADNKAGNNSTWVASPTLVGNPAKGDNCVFAFDPNTKTITITKVEAGGTSANYTFHAGDKIYYDLTGYNKGCNIYNAAGNEFGTWASNTSSIIEITLTQDLTITESSNLFKSEANGWQGVTAAIPTEGQNMIVSTDGKTAHWDTYAPTTPPAPTTTTDVTIKGSWDSWTAASSFVRIVAGGELATVTLNLTEKKNYTFKLIEGGEYTGKDNTTLTRAANSMTLASKGSGSNINLTVDQAGDYIFTYNLTSRALTVTYPDLDPAVDFVGLSDKVEVNTPVTFVAEAVEMVNPVYTYYVKQGEGEYAQVTNPYTFTAAGAYTVKVVANGDNDKSAFAEKTITVAELKTIYYINDKEWAQVNAHMWDGTATSTTWPGTAMTNSGNTVRELPIYTVSFEEGDYGKIIFSNNGDNQTANQTIDLAKPYFYDGVWYASLAEIEAAIDQAAAEAALRTEFFLVGTFNSWNTTSDRLMKPTADATMAYATITVAEAASYSEINFKLQESGHWRGINDNTTTSRFDKKVEVVKSEDGNKMYFTPDMAGDYVVALNLETREISVNYPAKQFYVPGILGDENWDANAHPMDLETATITFSNVAIGAYQFKVTDGSWDDGHVFTDLADDCSDKVRGGNGENIQIYLAEVGDVTVALVEGKVRVVGNFSDVVINNWTIVGSKILLGTTNEYDKDAVDNEMTENEGVWTLIKNKVELTAQTYGYKVVANHNWNEGQYPEGTGHQDLVIAEDGLYDITFTWTPATNVLTAEAVMLPSAHIAISSVYEYATYYGATALRVPDDVEAYYVSGISGEELEMVSIDVIPAETGVILYAERGGDYEFRQTTTTEDYSDVNWLKGSLEATTINNSLTHYILSATTPENIGLYYPKGTGNNNGVGAFTNGANKAYLEVPAASPVSARSFVFRKPGVVTALENKEVKTEGVKVLQNGQLMIIRGAHRYNAMGQLVK